MEQNDTTNNQFPEISSKLEVAKDINVRHTPQEQAEKEIRAILNEAYNRRDLGEDWAVSELESFIQNLLLSERNRLFDEVGKMKKDFRGENCSCHINPPCSSCESVDVDEIENYNYGLRIAQNIIKPKE